jgi:hypothetical protein
MPSLRERLAAWQAARQAFGGTTKLFVDAGVVPCPAQGDISIELCLACPHLRDVHGQPVDQITCHPGIARTLQDLSPAAS